MKKIGFILLVCVITFIGIGTTISGAAQISGMGLSGVIEKNVVMVCFAIPLIVLPFFAAYAAIVLKTLKESKI